LNSSFLLKIKRELCKIEVGWDYYFIARKFKKKSQRDEIFIEKNLPISKEPQRGEILSTICRSAGAFGTAHFMNL